MRLSLNLSLLSFFIQVLLLHELVLDLLGLLLAFVPNALEIGEYLLEP